MSESSKVIDARGLACPQPVVLTKKAIEEGSGESLEVIVDNEAAKENVLRFAEFSGRSAKALPGEGGVTRIIIQAAGRAAPKASDSAEASAAGHAPNAAAAAAEKRDASSARERESGLDTTVFLASDKIGHGDDELGALLMRGFIYALAEGEEKPGRIILMNAGVKLAVEGSDSLANLIRLGEQGVEILACGTCLDFYGIKEKLAAGRVSNMYEIAELLVRGRVLRP